MLAIKKTFFAIIISFVAFNSAYAGELSFQDKLVAAAIERTQHNVRYDGSYLPIKYPGGDVPDNIGVCSDVIVRSYRALGIDLQKEVHEDMQAHFDLYPKIWGLSKPDTNIDHRRVPNLQIFFSRYGKVLPITLEPKKYQPGDIVTWNIANWWRKSLRGKKVIPHIGIVTNETSLAGVPLVVHNIGQGTKLEDMLFDFEITGHYRYTPKKEEAP